MLSAPNIVHPLGRSFSEQSDLIPLYLLRFDRENTRRAYTRDIEAFFGSPVVTLQMARTATFTSVNEFVTAQEAAGKAVATIRRQVAALRGFFAWLIALGQLTLNPADRHLIRRIPRENAQNRLVTVLTRDDAGRLLNQVDLDSSTGPRDYALMTVLLHCVLRRSEAAAMNVEHLQSVGTYAVLQIPKAKGGVNQSVKIPDHVMMLLRQTIDHYGYTSGPLWRSFSRNESKGQRLSGTSIYKIVNTHARMAGILDRVGAHTLRHTGCTLAIEGGATIQQVQTHARHKNIETTMLYVHQRDRLAHSAADFIHVAPASLPSASPFRGE